MARAEWYRWIGRAIVAGSVGGAVFPLACSESSSRRAGLAQGCTVNSECDEGLVCTAGRCHEECLGSRDCPRGSLCVQLATDLRVCQLDVEVECETRGCVGLLTCAADERCRNACTSATDCISGQVCAESACAEPGETTGEGTLPPPPSCTDGERSGNETGVDCGGRCVACAGAGGGTGAGGSPNGGGSAGVSGADAGSGGAQGAGGGPIQGAGRVWCGGTECPLNNLVCCVASGSTYYCASECTGGGPGFVFTIACDGPNDCGGGPCSYTPPIPGPPGYRCEPPCGDAAAVGCKALGCGSPEECPLGSKCCRDGSGVTSCETSCTGTVVCQGNTDCQLGERCVSRAATGVAAPELFFGCQPDPEAGKVRCGAENCVTGAGETCCVGAVPDTCLPQCSPSQMRRDCDGPEDCPGESCCIQTGDGGVPRATCVAGSCLGQPDSVQVGCSGRFNCQPGEDCCLSGSQTSCLRNCPITNVVCNGDEDCTPFSQATCRPAGTEPLPGVRLCE